MEAPPNHTYLYVRDRSGGQWILEGRPEFATPDVGAVRPWGRLRAFATRGAYGYRGTDDALLDYRQGDRRTVACSVVDRLRSESESFDAGTSVAYYPAGPNSNALTRWLLNRVGLDVFGDPPNALNWSASLAAVGASY